MSWNYKNRIITIKSFESEEFDIVIIGGGITGAGILLDATSRGLKAVLIEKEDFASGTSSRSTKLIHGGLRYLKNLEFKIVRETGKERAIAYKNAPHLVVPEKMILPIQKGGTYGKWMTSFALWMYDWLADVAKSERRKMLNKEQTLAMEPNLKPDLLKGSGFYSEYRTDDARLTLEIIKTAQRSGAVALNYIEAKTLKYDENGKINSIVANDNLNNNSFEIKGKVFINACGPWSDEIRQIDQSMNNKRLHLTKGVHIVIDRQKLPLKNSVYFDVEGGRMIFAIPRGKVTYIGTTDTNYEGKKDNPNVTMEDVEYLINAANEMFPNIQLEIDDVQSSWSGLRPLIHEEGKSPSELSRKDEIYLSPKGLITIAGGKLTGYRIMAQKVVDIVCERLKINQKCITDSIQINGYGKEIDKKQILDKIKTLKISISEQDFENMWHIYGVQILKIIELFEKDSNRDLLVSEVMFCIENEMTLSLLDFYVRRTGMMYFDIKRVKSSLDKIANIFKEHYQWDESKLQSEIQLVKDEIKNRSIFE